MCIVITIVLVVFVVHVEGLQCCCVLEGRNSASITGYLLQKDILGPSIHIIHGV